MSVEEAVRIRSGPVELAGTLFKPEGARQFPVVVALHAASGGERGFFAYRHLAEALPTHGNCRGFEVLRIDKGHFGDVTLDGLTCGILYAWPGPIFEGKGEMQAIIDERADPAQREALTKILHGEETAEGATHWWVVRAR